MQILITLFVLLFSLVVHEMAHAYAALRLGDDTALRMGRLTLNPMAHLDPVGSLLFPIMGMVMGGFVIGWAKPVPVNTLRLKNPLRDHAIVAAAGPASNLVLAFVSAILLGVVMGVGHGMGGEAAGDGLIFLSLLFRRGVELNILLALFNLIPIPPLDGSWILLTFLRGEAQRLYLQLRNYGFFIIIALMMLGGLRLVLWPAMSWVGGFYYEVVFAVAKLFS